MKLLSAYDPHPQSRHFTTPRLTVGRLLPLFFVFLLPCCSWAQQPAAPADLSPIDGETYYLVNQLSGLQVDLDNGSSTAGDSILLQSRSFTSLTQRWAMTRLTGGVWAIANLANGLCLDSVTSGNSTSTVQNPCSPSNSTQQWSLTAASNGYCTLTNQGTGLALDVANGSSSPGAALNQTTASVPAAQSQQWLLRPAFFRGVDNALLEKQEADRIAANLPWWLDAGQSQDVLQILKNHGVNMVRIRPTSTPPYQTYTLASSPSAVPATCTANGCYAETDSADLDLAKRAKQLGLSVELTLFFDGGSSSAIPGVWSGDSLTQAESAVYSYVKAEVEAYRSAGVMPDMVTIGNEVDTGFFGSLGSPSGSNFSPFAALQNQAMQAVLDAAADTTIGPAIPAPLRCIHITPAWDLTNFFTYVNSSSIPYDAVCQSYYPFFHGPLTTAQAAASNPNGKPVEQTALTTAANSLGKPIFLIEVGEHYENGFDSNDPWYPATVAGQRQFLIDVNTVLKGLPNHLGMGMEYWDAEGVNTPKQSGGATNGDNQPDGTYAWNGLTLFDNADTSGSSLSTAANYSAILGGADALGGKLDPTLAYKLVNVASGRLLETAGVATAQGTPLDTAASNGGAVLRQQWSIASNGDGFLQIANLNVAQGATAAVLDNGGSSAAGSAVVVKAAASSASSQEWNLVTAGNGHYTIVNKSSGLVLAAAGAAPGAIEQESPSGASLDWITPADQTQLWQVVPVHITQPATASQLAFAANTIAAATYGMDLGAVRVDVQDSTGSLVSSPAQSITLNITGPGNFNQSVIASSSNGEADFNLSSVILGATGNYVLTASGTGLTSATATVDVTAATLTVTAQNASRAYGTSDPAFTYAIAGFVNGDTQSVVTGAPILTSGATVTSAPATYSINIAAGTLSATNYTFILAPGTLTISAASTATSLISSALTVNPGQSVKLTANVTSPSSFMPTGSVNFLNGTTSLGSAAVDGTGTAIYSGALLPGTNSITAEFVANSDFAASTSTAVVVTEPDYSMTANQNSLSVTPGGSGNLTLTFTPVGGYQGTVAMSCSSPVSGLSCTFNPASYTLDGSDKVLTGTATIAAASSIAALHSPFRRGPNPALHAAFCWLPGGAVLLLAAFERRRLARNPRVRQMFLLLVLLIASAAGITACGGGGSGSGVTTPQQPVSGVVTIAGIGSTGNVSQTVQVTVTVN